MQEREVRELFAKNLKRLRTQRGLSQLKFASEIQMALTFINDIENCKKWVSPETLARFATFFNVPVYAFFAEESSDQNAVDSRLAEALSAEINSAIQNVLANFR